MRERMLTMNIFSKFINGIKSFFSRKRLRLNHDTYRENGYINYYSKSKRKWFKEPLEDDGSVGVTVVKWEPLSNEEKEEMHKNFASNNDVIMIHQARLEKNRLK